MTTTATATTTTATKTSRQSSSWFSLLGSFLLSLSVFLSISVLIIVYISIALPLTKWPRNTFGGLLGETLIDSPSSAKDFANQAVQEAHELLLVWEDEKDDTTKKNWNVVYNSSTTTNSPAPAAAATTKNNNNDDDDDTVRNQILVTTKNLVIEARNITTGPYATSNVLLTRFRFEIISSNVNNNNNNNNIKNNKSYNYTADDVYTAMLSLDGMLFPSFEYQQLLSSPDMSFTAAHTTPNVDERIIMTEEDETEETSRTYSTSSSSPGLSCLTKKNDHNYFYREAIPNWRVHNNNNQQQQQQQQQQKGRLEIVAGCIPLPPIFSLFQQLRRGDEKDNHKDTTQQQQQKQQHLELVALNAVVPSQRLWISKSIVHPSLPGASRYYNDDTTKEASSSSRRVVHSIALRVNDNNALGEKAKSYDDNGTIVVVEGVVFVAPPTLPTTSTTTTTTTTPLAFSSTSSSSSSSMSLLFDPHRIDEVLMNWITCRFGPQEFMRQLQERLQETIRVRMMKK